MPRLLEKWQLVGSRLLEWVLTVLEWLLTALKWVLIALLVDVQEGLALGGISGKVEQRLGGVQEHLHLDRITLQICQLRI